MSFVSAVGKNNGDIAGYERFFWSAVKFRFLFQKKSTLKINNLITV